MGRITETYVVVVIVTMVSVNVGGETKCLWLWCMDVEKRSIWDPCKNDLTDRDAVWDGLVRGTVCYMGVTIPVGEKAIFGETCASGGIAHRGEVWYLRLPCWICNCKALCTFYELSWTEITPCNRIIMPESMGHSVQARIKNLTRGD